MLLIRLFCTPLLGQIRIGGPALSKTFDFGHFGTQLITSGLREFEIHFECLGTRAVEHSPEVIYLSRQAQAVACNQNRPK